MSCPGNIGENVQRFPVLIDAIIELLQLIHYPLVKTDVSSFGVASDSQLAKKR